MKRKTAFSMNHAKAVIAQVGRFFITFSLCSIVVLLFSVNAKAANVVDSGTCGDNIT